MRIGGESTKAQTDNGEQRHQLSTDGTNHEIARMPIRRSDHQAMQPAEHVRSVPRAGHHAECHSHTERDQHGREGVAFDAGLNLSTCRVDA